MNKLTDEVRKENEERFKHIMESVKKDGKDKFLTYLLNNTDYMTAPASEKGMLACPGGLLAHSLHVYDCMMRKMGSPSWKNMAKNIPTESLILMSLFCNICYTRYYKAVCDNKENIIRYEIVNEVPFGRGEKSVWIMSNYMKMTPDEVYAIRWFHEDIHEPAFLASIRKHPVALALYEAELEASLVIEGRCL